ncbi:MAG: hypothetical protein ACYCY5_04780 [Sulfuricella sp.]
MKKYVWIVIAVVLFFLGLIIAYTLPSPDRSVADDAATAAEKSH